MIKTFALGRLTADPELQKISVGDGKTADLLKFSIAVNEYRYVNDEKVKYTHFFDCEAWDSGARVLSEQTHKGDLIAIDGKLRQNRWETTDGQKRSKVVIRVENFTIAQRVNRDADTSVPEDETPNEPAPVGAEDDSKVAPF